MRVKCLAQEHNTMSPARARTLTVRSGVERTNPEATAPPTTMQSYAKPGCYVSDRGQYFTVLSLKEASHTTWEQIELLMHLTIDVLSNF